MPMAEQRAGPVPCRAESYVRAMEICLCGGVVGSHCHARFHTVSGPWLLLVWEIVQATAAISAVSRKEEFQEVFETASGGCGGLPHGVKVDRLPLQGQPV